MPVTVVFVRRAEADDFDFLADLDDAALDTAGDDGAAACDREHVFDRHEERLILRALRHAGCSRPPRPSAPGSTSRRVPASPSSALSAEPLTIGILSPGKLYLVSSSRTSSSTRSRSSWIVDHVDLVQEDDDRRHADLAGEQDVLAGLRHRAVGGADDEDRAVHLRGAGDHVLDVVGVAGTVDVRVVALVGLVLDVRGVDRDAALLFLRSLVDLVIGGVGRQTLFGQDLGDRRRQGGLAVIDVSDRADVQCGLVRLNFSLAMFTPPVPVYGLHARNRSVNARSGQLRLNSSATFCGTCCVVIELHRESARGPGSWSAAC